MSGIEFLVASFSSSSSSAHIQSSGVPLHPCLLFHNANKSHRPLSSATARTQMGLNSGSRSQAISECTLSRALTCDITAESSIFHSQREEMSSLVVFFFFTVQLLFFYFFFTFPSSPHPLPPHSGRPARVRRCD